MTVKPVMLNGFDFRGVEVQAQVTKLCIARQFSPLD